MFDRPLQVHFIIRMLRKYVTPITESDLYDLFGCFSSSDSLYPILATFLCSKRMKASERVMPDQIYSSSDNPYPFKNPRVVIINNFTRGKKIRQGNSGIVLLQPAPIVGKVANDCGFFAVGGQTNEFL